MSALEVAIEELKSLPPHRLAEAVSYLRTLRERTLEERNAGLMKTAGFLSKEEADEWERAIEEACGKVDQGDW